MYIFICQYYYYTYIEIREIFTLNIFHAHHHFFRRLVLSFHSQYVFQPFLLTSSILDV